MTSPFKPVKGMPLERRLWGQVTIGDGTGCWIWTGYRERNGYGRIRVCGRREGVHRLVYELLIGEVPEGLHVCHHCDVRACVRPDHLFVGTPEDNMLDAAAKGRMARGARHKRSRLTAEDVRDIRRRWQAGERLCKLAREYRVHYSAVDHAVHRRSWAWLQ